MQAVLVDLDETLYAPGDALIQTVDRRITAFIAWRVGLPWDRADLMRRDLWIEFGTTARGLNRLFDIDPREVYRFAVDAVDPSLHLVLDQTVGEALRRISAPRYVFTNASRGYAERVLETLGIASCFDGIFSIESCFYNPKPTPICYRRILSTLGLDGERVAFLDDNPNNFAPALALGMTCVQVGERGGAPEGVSRVARFQDVPDVLSSLGF